MTFSKDPLSLSIEPPRTLSSASCPQNMYIWNPRTRLSRKARENPAKTIGSLTSVAVVNSRARHPATCEITATADNCPVERLVWFS